MFVELHMLQSFAPANLNRDDTNNPKDCEFGGARRARISSQCIKRAVRNSPVFAETTKVEVGTRTKWLINLLRERLVDAGKSATEATALLRAFVPEYASKLQGNSERTAVLLYLSQDEVQAIVQALLERWNELSDSKLQADLVKALVKAHRGRTSAPDIALFGRMLAERPELSLDAACQVAHAISTHRVTMEMDFYTAVDDLKPAETAGAGMMGFTGFDSACFYRYARIDWAQLQRNLCGDADLARCTVAAFLRAAVAAVPSGKQNSFAAYNPPSLLLGVVRKDGMGWSLANAFERPIQSRGADGLMVPSVQALDAYWGRMCQVYGTDALVRVAVLALDAGFWLAHLQSSQVENLDAWVAALTEALPGGELSV